MLAECCGASEEAKDEKDAVLAGNAFGVLSRIGLASTDTNVQVQHFATHCNTLQDAATHCHTLHQTTSYRYISTHTVGAACTVYGKRVGSVKKRIYKLCIHILT